MSITDKEVKLVKTIGTIIREKRIANGLSAGQIASKLSRPISKQAFANRERNGRFPFDMVVEIADILNCPMSDFYAGETINCCQSKKSHTSA